jgi:regulator of RNase E activity RraB
MMHKEATKDALLRIAENGSDMSKPMEMEFFLTAMTEDAAVKMAKAARDLGFETSIKAIDEGDEELPPYTCYCSKWVIASLENVTAIEIELSKVARKFGGDIDGFGTTGNVDSWI